MSKQYFTKILKHLLNQSQLLLKNDFTWQIFNRDGLPITDPYGTLEVSDEMIYVFHRLMDIRDKLPNYAIDIQFLKENFIVGLGAPDALVQLFRDLDLLVQNIVNPPPCRIAYKIFSYDDKILYQNGEIPKELNISIILQVAHQIDKACSQVYELFMGNSQKLAFLGMRHSSHNKQYSIITSSGQKTFLIGMVQSDNLGNMFYLTQEYHPLIEKI
ncbi:MAG: hypothetical protein ACTSYB_11120 [Candidatus Helarchaeota archaeon]